MWHVTHDLWHVTCDTWHVTLRGPHGPSQGVWRGGPMRGLESGHVTCWEDLSNGRRCLFHRGQTCMHTDGHRDSMTGLAQWADSVKTNKELTENPIKTCLENVLNKLQFMNPGTSKQTFILVWNGWSLYSFYGQTFWTSLHYTYPMHNAS